MVNMNVYAPQWGSVVFSQAVSLGNFCHAAQLLKEIGYRTFSGPFDWIFNNPRALAHILNDDFQTFLNSSYYQPVPIEERVVREANLCHHKFYQEHYGVQHMFNHHSPDKAEDHQYFIRAVEEFRSSLASRTPILLLLVTHSLIKPDLIEPILKGLDRYQGVYKLLCLRFVHDENNPVLSDQINTISHDQRQLCINFRVAKPSNGVVFPQAQDNQRLREFLQNFRVHTQ